MNGDWQVSLPVANEDLAWVKAALKKNSSRVVAHDKDSAIEVDQKAEGVANGTFLLDVEGFMKS